MSLLDRVRGRFSGFYQADVDPHEWRLPKPSSSSSLSSASFSSPSPSPLLKGDHNNSHNRKGSSGRNGPLIPDPAIFRNAFVPPSTTDPARAVADGRLTYPDASHAAVHLALLECFAHLRRSVRQKLPDAILGSGGASLPADEDRENNGVDGDDHDDDTDDSDDDDEKSSSSDKSSLIGTSSSSSSGKSSSRRSGERKRTRTWRRMKGKKDGDDESGDEGDDDDGDDAEDEESQKRWDLLIRLAVTRFGVWWANIDKLLDHATAYTPSYHHHHHSPSPSQSQEAATAVVVVQLTPDYLPPLDVLLVWYAFMLSPPTSPHTTNNNAVVGPSGTDGVTFPPLPSSSPYDAACRAHHHRALQHLCFPWPAIRDVISFSTPTSGSTSISSSASSSKPSTATEYHLPRAAANLFRTLSDQPADVLEYLEAPPAYVEGAGVLAGDSGNGGGGGGGEGIVGGVDLFAAVKTQVEPFLARAASLDWLRGPPRTLAGSLERAEEAYRGFLLRGGAQVAGQRGRFELDFERGNENGNGNGNGKGVDEEEEVDEGDSDGDDDKAKSKEPGEESHQQKRRHHHHHHHHHHHRNQIPFGVSLIWRTHRLFPAQYRLFSEGDALAELRRSVLGPGAGWKQLDEMLGDYDQQEGDAADVCECWTCERIRDEAPGFAYDRAAAAAGAGAGAGSPSYDVSVVQALSMEQLRSIQEDLGICHAVREKRRKQGKRKGTRSQQQQQKISAGRIFSRGVKAMEDRRRSWRLD